MKPSELAQLLAATIPAKMPVLITGDPGVGKSDIVAQAAQAAGAGMLLSHPAVEDPVDSKGLPFVIDGQAIFLPFGDLLAAMQTDRPLVWFFDDLGQAPSAVQAAKMQLLLAREVCGHRLSEHVTFVAATNYRKKGMGVSGILEPVKNRFATIVALEPDLDEFCQWAIDHDTHPLVIAFQRFRPDLLCNHAESPNDMGGIPTPRSWVNGVSRLLSLTLPPAILAHAIRGAVGEGAAVEFLAFMRLYQELPSVDQIVLDPDAVPVPTKSATRYALVSAMASKTTATNFPRFTRYAERLVDAMAGEFAVLYLRDVLRRDASLAKTAAYIRLVTGDMAELVSGVKK